MIDFPRIRDLQEGERKEFDRWLAGQTRPGIEGLPDSEQDGYYEWDYERWKSVRMGCPDIWD